MNLTSYIDEFSDTIMPCLPLGVCLYKFKTNYPRAIGILTVYLFLSFVVFFFSNYLADRKINNLFIYNFFPLVEVILITLILESSLKDEFRKVGIVLCSTLTFLFLYKFFSIDIMVNYSASLALMADLMMVLLSILCLYKILNNQFLNNFNTGFLFWFSISLMVYACGSFMTEALYALNSGKGKTFTTKIWLVKDALLIIKYCMITKCILIAADLKTIELKN